MPQKGLVIIMKKIIAVLLCFLFVFVPVALADNSTLEGTIWELGMIGVIETDERLFKEDIIANDLMITFEFKANAVVTLTMPDGSVDGEYRVSGDDLEMDFPIGNTRTTITERDGVYMLSFINVFVEGQIHMFVLRSGTVGGSTPGTPDPAPDPTPTPTPAPAVVEPTPAAPVPSQTVPELEGTTWEIVRAESPDGVLDRNELIAIDYLIEFQFRRNGAVTCRARSDNRWIEERGTYRLSGNTLSINIPSIPAITTTIENGSFTVLNFNNTGEDYTFRQSSSPSSSSGAGMPRWARDALWGAGLGAVVGVVMWLIGSKKKKKKAAAAAAAAGNTSAPPAYAPAPTAYVHMTTPAPVAPTPVAPTPLGAPPQLRCQSGPMAGATFPVSGSLRLGRDPSRCQIIFPVETQGISALHCEVQQQSSGILLTDHGSTYGTFLAGGRKLSANESVTINSGDSFYLADKDNTFTVL